MRLRFRRAAVTVVTAVALTMVLAPGAHAAHQPMPDTWSPSAPTSGWTRAWGHNDATLAYSGFSGSTRQTTYWGQALCNGGYNCTNYVAYRLQRNGAPNFVQQCATGSNATSWDERARRCGIRVDTVPAPGAVLHWDAQAYGNTAGHVAYVDAVVGDMLLISQAGCSGGASREIKSMSALRAAGLNNGTIEFIHPLDLPNPGNVAQPVPVPAVRGGTVWEAAFTNGWKNLDPQTISGATDVAAMTIGDVKYVYSIIDGVVHEAVSNNGWKNLSTGISADAVAVTHAEGVKLVYTLKNGIAYEAASNNGWRSLPLGTVAGATDIAATTVGGDRVVYTLINGTAYEAVFSNGWRNLPLGTVHGASRIAAMSVDGVKFVYTLQNGTVHEAASDNAWRNLSTATVNSATELAVARNGSQKLIYTLVGGVPHEAASDNGWLNLSTGIAPGAAGLTASVDSSGGRFVYTIR